MSDIAPQRRMIQVEETKYKSAVSEFTWQKIGGAINMINTYQTIKLQFGITKADSNSGSPTYNVISTPYSDFGFKETFPFNAEIVGANIYHGTAGSSGTSELDIKWAAVNSGSYSTIFSTTPKVASTAASEVAFDTFGNATTPTGCTVPVFSKTVFAAGDKLRCDVLQVMGGTPNGFIIDIFYRVLSP